MARRLSGLLQIHGCSKIYLARATILVGSPASITQFRHCSLVAAAVPLR